MGRYKVETFGMRSLQRNSNVSKLLKQSLFVSLKYVGIHNVKYLLYKCYLNTNVRGTR
jgi:hypothetical protein